jgi:16S rRNA processing protein RimM
MGRISAPFGIQGWVKVYALTAHIGNLRDYPVWWLGHADDWREMTVVDVKVHGKALVALLEGVSDRDRAAQLKGQEIAVTRAELPHTAQNEFYWADLIGLKVTNTEQYEFGRVTRIIQTGANDVLVVESSASDGRETLIPFIADVIRKVDVTAGVIKVDWGSDY